MPVDNDWGVQFKKLSDDQEELKNDVVSLKKEYNDELGNLKKYLADKFVKVLNAIDSIKKRN